MLKESYQAILNKMELYCVVGGEANSVKRWQEDLSAQFFPTYKDGKKVSASQHSYASSN